MTAAATPELPAPKAAGSRVPFSMWRAPDGTVRRDLAVSELARVVRAGEGTLWVDVDSSQRSQHALLEKVFGFHPLTIEDTLNPQSRVKYEEHPGYLFVVARGVRFCEDTSDPYDIETLNLYAYLGPCWVVTVHGEGATAVDAVKARAEASPDALARGPARLMHAVLDEAVDEFFPILDRIDEFLDGLEERVFVQFDQAALRDIFSVKRLVLQLRRHLAPQREVLNQLTNRPNELLPASAQLYFRDVYDHVLRINDSIDAYRELLSSTLDSYLSQVSNRLGQSSKALAVVATVTLPFVIVSGMWGMNFDRVPLAHHPHGFWLLLGAQLLIAAVILAALRWRRII
ncbi:magnesium transporter CorA family protein [Roseisolibacter sp. H3M3-2]|uniref:magnesium transporter CorA family protein n=1 Tax=Roseisolibacter sp. H3M3-2 TaxID=3031323 RepID=UPI0023DB0B20|nr:magnesium transporter CorA family protein [Roseisolibacter sp. H3M3-2]MDF1502151.1 magnesium transporter CorA family protein [Roseisolibacter sp. H3M3-2]